MRNRINQSILTVKPYVPGKPIEEVKRELGLKQVVKLASNESPFGPSPKVLKAIKNEASRVNRYPDGQCFYLRRELAKRLKIKPEQLIFGNGSDEIIILAIRAFVSPGDEVLIAKPSFLIYEIGSKLAGGAVREIPLKNMRYDLQEMKKAVSKKTKIVFLGNPDNPAGTYITQKELNDFIRSVPKDVLIFIDEAYFEYVTAKDYPDSARLIKKHKNVVGIRTFSKMYGLAGLRVGYGFGNTEVIGYLNRLREPFNVNSLAQAAALACLKDQAYYKRIASEVKKQRQVLYKGFKKLGLFYHESVTNFILVDIGNNGSTVAKKLLKKGVIVRDMVFWGMKTFIRVSIGSEKENQKLLKALKEVLR